MICQQCGGEFACVVGRPIFCSVTCQARHADENADHRCAQCKQAFVRPAYKSSLSGLRFCTQFCAERYAFNVDPRKRVDDPAAVDVLTRAARKARPLRKVSEVVDELAGLWGLDSDDAEAVIVQLADKIRAQSDVGAYFEHEKAAALGPADPTPSAGPGSPSKPLDPE